MDLAVYLTYFFAAVWIGFGLFCKVLGLVPRQREIVARILRGTHATALTRAIGIAEVGMAIWIISGIHPRLNAITQIVLVATMNVVEYSRARDLLLFGRANAIVAALFILLIFYKEFFL